MDRNGFWEQEQRSPAARIATSTAANSAPNNNNLALASAAPSSPQIKFEEGTSGSGGEAIGDHASSNHLICKEDQQSIFRYCEGNLNFATVTAADDDDFNFQKKKALSRNGTILERHLLLGPGGPNQQPLAYAPQAFVAAAEAAKSKRKRLVKEDPMSHRIIEKRRRDRMNNCLADLSRLIPAEYLKKGRGRVEKTEIIEMAIKHMKYLQAHACNHVGSELPEQGGQESQAQGQMDAATSAVEHYRLGYQECLSETMHFLVEVEGYFAGDSLCVQLINHLQKHCEKIVKGDRLNFSRPMRSETLSSSSRGYSGYSGGPSSTSSGSDSGGNGHSSSSKENVTLNSEWRRQNNIEEMPSPVPLPPNSMGHQSLPPPPPPLMVEQAESPSPTSDAGSDVTGSSSSQLREMLTSAAASGAAPGQRRLSESSRTAESVAAGLYKFKNNIKQRFSAEHHHDDECKRRRLLSTGGSSDGAPAATPASVVVKLRGGSGGGGGGDSGFDSPPANLMVKRQSPSPSPMDAPTPPAAPSPSFGVPVFALHSKGAFYIPLTIDNELLAPYMSNFGEQGHVLHPVTISVNFCGLAAAPQQQAAPMIPWRGEAAGFVPKWTVCDRT